MINKFFILSLSLVPATSFATNLVTHFPMVPDDFGRLTESISGSRITVNGRHTNEIMPGAVGDAMRFDGYSTYATGDLQGTLPTGDMTVGIWLAPETYPVIDVEKATTDKTVVAGTINHDTKNGWAFNLGQNGKYSFDCYVGGGWISSIEADEVLPCYEWSHLVAVVNTTEKKMTLYRNGEVVAERSNNILNSVDNDSKNIIIGKSATSSFGGSYLPDAYNGLIDEIEIYDGVLTAEEIASFVPENPADLSIPSSRFSADIMRPKFHGMPEANWTNETHGMTYSNGRYHVFFQKNANGPYMSRLHWGHISSENLYEWTEEPIALAPGDYFDIKGCWSGCIFTDDEITNGMPNAIYTGVDNAKAMIIQATPLDEDLIDWEKGNAPIINGRPSGLSDDFRDPYFFRNGNDAYIIVGSSKDELGVVTLHKYNAGTNSWSNDGKIFYQAKNKDLEGRFWEMPNLTRMDNGKWLFTVTPQGQSTGVHTIYWTGDISSDGTFIPDNETPKKVELISKEGYGLLSPTIYQHNGKTIALGIVPDKVSTEINCQLGWAHLYSFPREWSIDNSGNLIQKPYSGLRNLRGEENFTQKDFNLDGDLSLNPVNGRQIEVLAKFEAGPNKFGIDFLKNSSGKGRLTYDGSSNELKIDFTGLNRISNDQRVYNGIYSCMLPEKPSTGDDITINLFIDGSILDIFVNEKWATSIRLYVNDKDAIDLNAFSEGGVVKMKELSAWTLESDGGNNDSGIGEIIGSDSEMPDFVNVYSMTGTLLKKNVRPEYALKGLEKGIYIVGNKKSIVK